MNSVQFENDVSMAEFHQRYGTEDKCRRVLYRVRWLHGLRYSACEDQRRLTFWWDAPAICGYRVCGCRWESLARSLFEVTKLPLTKCFLAMYSLTSPKTNLAALLLMRYLAVCDRTVWRLAHKVTQAMLEREESGRLDRLVQIDDAHLNGECDGGQAGLGSRNKLTFVVTVETNPDAGASRVALDCHQFAVSPADGVDGGPWLDGVGQALTAVRANVIVVMCSALKQAYRLVILARERRAVRESLAVRRTAPVRRIPKPKHHSISALPLNSRSWVIEALAVDVTRFAVNVTRNTARGFLEVVRAVFENLGPPLRSSMVTGLPRTP